MKPRTPTLPTPGPPAPACLRVRERLAQLVDHGLAPVEAARDRGHLEACAGCAAELRAWEELLGAARDALAPPADDLEWALAGLEPRLVEAAAQGRRRRFRVLVGRGLVAAGTVAAAVLGLVALEAGGIGLESLGSPMDTAGLLPEVEFGLPHWAGLFEPEVR